MPGYVTGSSIKILMEATYDFTDIAPYENEVLKEKLASLLAEPAFRHAVTSVLRDIDFEQLK